MDQHYKARAVVEGPDETVVEAGDSLSGSAEGWAGWDSVASSEAGIPRMVDSWLRTGSEQGPFETFKTRFRKPLAGDDINFTACSRSSGCSSPIPRTDNMR